MNLLTRWIFFNQFQYPWTILTFSYNEKMSNGDSISIFVAVLINVKSKIPHSHKKNENRNENSVIAIS